MKPLIIITGITTFLVGGAVGMFIESCDTTYYKERADQTVNQARLNKDCLAVVEKTKDNLAICVDTANKLVDLVNTLADNLWELPVEDLNTLRKHPKPPALESISE